MSDFIFNKLRLHFFTIHHLRSASKANPQTRQEHQQHRADIPRTPPWRCWVLLGYCSCPKYWQILLPSMYVCGKYHRISPNIYIVIMNCIYLLIFAVKVRFLCLAEKCSGQNVSKSSQLMVFPPEPAYPFPSLHGWCSWGASSAVATSCIAWHWSAQDLLSKSMVSSVNFPLEHQHLGLSRTIFSYFFHSENWKI